VTYLDPVWRGVGESVAALNQRVHDVIEAQLAFGRAGSRSDRPRARSSGAEIDVPADQEVDPGRLGP